MRERRSPLGMALALAIALTLPSREARAEGPDGADAKPFFEAGLAHARAARWGEAIAAFERASALRSHAVTTYNIGACERVLGNSTRARRAFLEALAMHEASGRTALTERLVADSRAFIAEIEALLVHATLSVGPPGATLAVDGRPVTVLDAAAHPLLAAAGTEVATGGAPLPAPRIEVLLDPGPHVLIVSSPGHAPGVVKRVFTAGERASLDIALDRLPAELHVTSNRARAVVVVDGEDAGPPPVRLRRAAGSHRVVVRERGFVPYETVVTLDAGAETHLDARLSPVGWCDRRIR